jgi:hypothetical protein
MNYSRRYLLPVVALGIAVPAAEADAQSTPGPQLSGVIFANAQNGGTATGRSDNRFDIERVYLTVLAPAGDRVSVRFTTDLYQQRDSTRDGFYRGWALRAKYAWLQYDFVKSKDNGASLLGRVGLLHTPIAEYEESFFLRYVSSGSMDQAGFFSTADAGMALSLGLPQKMGEVYAAVLNGPGYTSRETDAYKDVGARFSFTPLARNKSFFSSLSLTPWFYDGRRASTASTSPGAPRRRDRYGFFAGVRDPRLQGGVQLARKFDEVDAAGSTAPRLVEGSVVSTFAVAKPAALLGGEPRRLALVLRLDQITSDKARGAQEKFFIGGLQYELSQRAAVTLDVQLVRPNDASTTRERRTYFAHFVANF